jgi:hypothetical protein
VVGLVVGIAVGFAAGLVAWRSLAPMAAGLYAIGITEGTQPPIKVAVAPTAGLANGLVVAICFGILVGSLPAWRAPIETRRRRLRSPKF